jgi:hypothetical protein
MTRPFLLIVDGGLWGLAWHVRRTLVHCKRGVAASVDRSHTSSEAMQTTRRPSLPLARLLMFSSGYQSCLFLVLIEPQSVLSPVIVDAAVLPQLT